MSQQKYSKLNMCPTPINVNDASHRFNMIYNFGSNHRAAVIGGKLDSMGHRCFIKTRNKNVQDSIPEHSTYVSSIGTFRALNEIDGYECWRVSTRDSLWRSTVIENSYIEYEFNTNRIVTGYVIVGDLNVQTASPTAWNVSVYDENTSTWVVLDSQTNQNIMDGLPHEYSFVNETAYTKFRITFIANSGCTEFVGVSQWQLFIGDTTINSNEIILDVDEENPIYFYRYVGKDSNDVPQTIVTKFTESKKIINTFKNEDTFLFAKFNNVLNKFEIYYDTFDNINKVYSIDEQRNDLIVLGTFKTDVDGAVIVVEYSGNIRTDKEHMVNGWCDRVKKPSNTPTRYFAASSTTDNIIYIMGGYDTSKENSAYDTFIDKWFNKQRMITGRYHLTASTVDNIVYAIDGHYNAHGDGTKAYAINEAYQPLTNSWTTKANVCVARSGINSSTENKYIYVFGGNTAPRNQNEKYDTLKNSWARNAIMLTGRSKFVSSTVNHIIYNIGGDVSPSNQNEAYDPSSDSWETKVDMITGRAVDGGAVYNDIYTISLNINEVYNIYVDSWKVNAEAPSITVGGVSIVNNYIYALGSNFSWKYDPKYDGVTFLGYHWFAKAQIPIQSNYSCSSVYNKDVYVLCGQNSVNNFKYDTQQDIWKTDTPLSVTLSSQTRPTVPCINANVVIPITSYKVSVLYATYSDSYLFKASITNTAWPSCGTDLNNNIYTVYDNAEGITTYKYKLRTDSWLARVSSAPQRHGSYMSASSIGNNVYALSGSTIKNAVSCYIPYLDVWNTKAESIGLTTYYCAVSTVKESLFYNNNGGKNLFKYDSITDTHINDHACQLGNRSNITSAVVNDSLYWLNGNVADTYEYVLK